MNVRNQPAYEKSVFVSCPFDSQFRDLLLAIVHAVAAHGFFPRSARESEGTAEPRMSRILKTLSECKYSIHDLSRFTGEGVDNASRFNMPLELGMAAALRFERANSDHPHNWLALVPEGFLYQRFVRTWRGLIQEDTRNRLIPLSGKYQPGCVFKMTLLTLHPLRWTSSIHLAPFGN